MILKNKECCPVLFFINLFLLVFEMSYLTSVDRLSLISLLFVSLFLYFIQEIQILKKDLYVILHSSSKDIMLLADLSLLS